MRANRVAIASDAFCNTHDTERNRVTADQTYATGRARDAAALTIDVEDWFHSYNVKRAIGFDAWDRCELRVERNTERIIEVLEAQGVRATFFVLGWVAEKCPHLVRRIAEAGHEIGSHGFGHEPVYSLTPSQFRADITRSKLFLEDLTGQLVRGYRAPCFSIVDWALPILQDVGFSYDSSSVPTIGHDRYGHLDSLDAGNPIVQLKDGFAEASISCLKLGKRGIPWGGGGYFRLVPYKLWLRGVHSILQSGLPYIFYIHPWELDDSQPDIPGIGVVNRFRQRINLANCEKRFISLARAFDWTPLCDLIDRTLAEAEFRNKRGRATDMPAHASCTP